MSILGLFFRGRGRLYLVKGNRIEEVDGRMVFEQDLAQRQVYPTGQWQVGRIGYVSYEGECELLDDGLRDHQHDGFYFFSRKAVPQETLKRGLEQFRLAFRRVDQQQETSALEAVC